MFSLPGELQEPTDSCPPQQFAQVLANGLIREMARGVKLIISSLLVFLVDLCQKRIPPTLKTGVLPAFQFEEFLLDGQGKPPPKPVESPLLTSAWR
jgi:hypothetical protein